MNPIKMRKAVATHRRKQQREMAKLSGYFESGTPHTDEEKAERKAKRRRRMKRKKRRGWA